MLSTSKTLLVGQQFTHNQFVHNDKLRNSRGLMTCHASPVRPGQCYFDRSENLETPGLHPTLKVSKKRNQACLVGLRCTFPSISLNNRANLFVHPGSASNPCYADIRSQFASLLRASQQNWLCQSLATHQANLEFSPCRPKDPSQYTVCPLRMS